MKLWHSCKFDVAVNITKNGVTILFGECVAHVDYDSIDGEIEYEVKAFEFSETFDGRMGHQDKIVRVTTITKDDLVLFNMLKSGIDEDRLLQQVCEFFTCEIADDSGYEHSFRVIA
jgi:hypothetical protein